MRAAQYFFTALFLFAVIVQYNDPDPGQWMTMYGAAALVCFLATRRIGAARRFWIAPAVVGAAALLWSAGIWLGIEHALMPWRMFEQWEMKDAAVEETRETFGLLIVAGWMAVTALTGSRGSTGSWGSTRSGSRAS
jgi:hypothetical protein